MRNKLVQPLPENIATRIKLVKDIIIDLADSLETKEDLWKAWKEITEALHYLSAKDNMLEYEEKIKEEK